MNYKNIIIYGGSSEISFELVKKLINHCEKLVIFCRNKNNLLESYNFSVKLFDEGTSTRRAMGQMRTLGIDSKKSKSKKDEVAAAIILQDYFDFMRSTRS